MPASTPSGDRSVFGGYFPIPTAGPDGRCVDSNYGHFADPVRANSCLREAPSTAAALSCHHLDARRFADIR